MSSSAEEVHFYQTLLSGDWSRVHTKQEAQALLTQIGTTCIRYNCDSSLFDKIMELRAEAGKGLRAIYYNVDSCRWRLITDRHNEKAIANDERFVLVYRK